MLVFRAAVYGCADPFLPKHVISLALKCVAQAGPTSGLGVVDESDICGYDASLITYPPTRRQWRLVQYVGYI